MVLEQLLKHFEETIQNNPKTREIERLINTISNEFSRDPQSLQTFPILILQSTFQRKKSSQSASLNFTKHYDMLSKVLLNILRISLKAIEPNKKKLIKDIIEYSEKFSKCVEKSYREGVAVFLRILKKHEISEFSAHQNKIKDIIKRLIEDKNHKVRIEALKLARSYDMKSEIIRVVKKDPNADLRKTAIEYLKGDDAQDILDDLSRCLEDPNSLIKLKALNYFIKEDVVPSVEGIRSLFKNLLTDQIPLNKSKSKELILKLLAKSDLVSVFKYMNIFLNDLENTEFFQTISQSFLELYGNRPGDLHPVIKTLFKRLLNEKEKIDLESLFVIRLCLSLYKSKNLSLQTFIEEFSLQEKLPVLIDFFLKNNEDIKQHYYMKLQCIIVISYIDLEERASDLVLSKYLEVCRSVKLIKFDLAKDINEINFELLAEFEQKTFSRFFYFALNEEEVIETIVEIVREKFKDAEKLYLLTFQDLIDGLSNGIAAEENDKNVLQAPLQLKIEKTDKKLKINQEHLNIAKQEKTVQAKREAKSLKTSASKLEKKKITLQQVMYEKEYRSLLVISYVLRFAELTESIHPEFSSLSHTLFARKLDSDNLYVSVLALKCLGYSCLLSNDQSRQYIDTLVKKLKHKVDIIHILSVVHIFDILLCRKIDDVDIVTETISYLWISFKDETSPIGQFVIVEGFAKLLLKNIISAPLEIFVHILDIFFDTKTTTDTFNLIQALFRNYLKFSEEKTIELATAFLVYLFLHKKNTGFKLQNPKTDEKMCKFCLLFDPKLERPYEKTENIQMLIFVFSVKHAEKNLRFYMKIINAINLEEFNLDAAKYAKDRLTELMPNKSVQKEIEKMIKRLNFGTEVVEDISFREYEKRVEDIQSLAERISRQDSIIVID